MKPDRDSVGESSNASNDDGWSLLCVVRPQIERSENTMPAGTRIGEMLRDQAAIWRLPARAVPRHLGQLICNGRRQSFVVYSPKTRVKRRLLLGAQALFHVIAVPAFAAKWMIETRFRARPEQRSAALATRTRTQEPGKR